MLPALLRKLIGIVPGRRTVPIRAWLTAEALEARQLLAGDLTILNGALTEVLVDQFNAINLIANFSVANIGDQDISADNVAFQAVVSADLVFGNGDDFAVGGNSGLVDLVASASVGRVISGTSNLSEYQASNFLLIKVDFANTVVEGDETNNVIAIPLPRLPLIDTSDGQTAGATNKVIVVDPSLTVSDADTQNFNGGSLRVSIANDEGENNILAVKKTKTAAGTLRRVKEELRVGKNVIGTVTGGSGAQPLVIHFNTHVTAQDIRGIASVITLRGKKGVTGPRTVQFQVIEPTIVSGPISTKVVNLS